MKCGNCKSKEHGTASEVRACYQGNQPHVQQHETGATFVQHPDRTPCDRCDGSGLYVWAIENDKPKLGGVCFRCKGKGYQTSDDKRRNWGYDNNCWNGMS